MTLGDVKRSNFMRFRLPCQFQRIFILQNFVFVLINERYRILILSSESCHRGGSLGRCGAQWVIFISNMVVLLIKSTGMTSSIECK